MAELLICFSGSADEKGQILDWIQSDPRDGENRNLPRRGQDGNRMANGFFFASCFSAQTLLLPLASGGLLRPAHANKKRKEKDRQVLLASPSASNHPFQGDAR